MKAVAVVAAPALGHVVHVFLKEMEREWAPRVRRLYVIAAGTNEAAPAAAEGTERIVRVPLPSASEASGAGAWLQERRRTEAEIRSAVDRIDDLDHVFFIGAGYSLRAQRALVRRGVRHSVLAWGRQSVTAREAWRSGRAPLRTRLGTLLVERAERRSLDMADRIVAESPRIVETLRLDRWKHKVEIAPVPGIDTSRFRARRPRGEREYDFAFIGRVTGQKGVLPFLDALTRLREGGQTFRALVRGKGDLDDEVDRRLSGDLGSFVDRERFGASDDMADVYSRTRALVLPTLAEGLPRSLREAMACECVVVATPVGGIADLVDHGRNGLIVPAPDPDRLADAMRRTLDPTFADELAGRARRTIEERYSSEAVKGALL